ncbi:MAG: hypothetical protein N2Z81_07265 [Hydrogenothermaceae bacterium]|nr:hypothetical protein [Hydrogenothermaceae bacterium]
MKKFVLFLIGSLFTLSSCVVATKPGASVVVTPNKVIVHPKVIFIPDYDVYILDDDRFEVYKYKGKWYWFNGGVWYIADDFNGPWVILKGNPPFKIPPGHLKKMYKQKWK